MAQCAKLVALVVVFVFCAACLVQAEEGEKFTKLNDKGQKLPSDAGQWAMIHDNTTGLMWEVKTTDGSIHDMGKTYNWEGANDVFIAELNRVKFGGFGDWRLPTTDELRTIRVKGAEPNINVAFFPNTASTGYFSVTECGSGDIFAERVKFGKIRNTKKDMRVRAVRGGDTKRE